MSLSPLAIVVLQHHRARPEESMYDIAALGTRSPTREDRDRLAVAYFELEEAGLVERTGEVVKYRGFPYSMYRPVAEGARGLSLTSGRPSRESG